MSTDIPIELRKIAYRQSAKDGLVIRLDKNSMPVPECGCVIWLGATRNKTREYGCIKYKGKVIQTHQAVWIVVNGDIPEDLHVLHKCDVRSCINPNHLFLGTNGDNVKDKTDKGRSYHPVGGLNPKAKLTPENVTFIRLSSLTDKSLAARFGVARQHINLIRHNKVWTAS